MSAYHVTVASLSRSHASPQLLFLVQFMTLTTRKIRGKFGSFTNNVYLCTDEKMMIMETKTPTKFILALRKYRAHKQEWAEKMQEKLATEEEELRRKRQYLYYDIETA